jgi:phosphatidylserine/phosphatidylglycerophosphate/cardiolipin synthase-like enzyme
MRRVEPGIAVLTPGRSVAKRGWIWLAGALAVVLIVAGVAVKAGGLTSYVTAASHSKTAKKAKKKVATGAVFNLPSGSKAQQQRIDRHVITLIRNAPKRATIYTNVYHLSDRVLAAELVKARKRGVRVRVIVDYWTTGTPAYKALKKALGTNLRKASWIIACPRDRGCIGVPYNGSVSVNHNKFFLFSTSGASRGVVVQSTANSTFRGRAKQWNSALTIVDGRLYAAYRHYFYDLSRRRGRADYSKTFRAGKYRLDLFPRAQGDPISEALNRVSCVGGTRIRVALSYFTWTPIARKLWQLDDQGCRVEAIGSDVSKQVIQEMTRSGGRHGGPVMRILQESGNRAGQHSKYMLIDGLYQGRRQKILFTGSVNYTLIGFRSSDETLLTVFDARLHDAYVANFTTVFRYGTKARVGGRSQTGVPYLLAPEGSDEATGPAADPATE